MNFTAISKSLSRRMKRNEKGVTTVEYAVMLVLVALAVAALGTGIGDSVTAVFRNIITALTPA